MGTLPDVDQAPTEGEMIQRIHGVNVAVKELEAAVNTYRRFSGQEPRPLDRKDFAFPGLRGAAFQLGETVINLVSSEREDTSIARFLRTRGEGLFLVSLLSDAVTEDVEALRQRGFAPVLQETVVATLGEPGESQLNTPSQKPASRVTILRWLRTIIGVD